MAGPNGAPKAPLRMVTAPHAPVPFSPDREDLYVAVKIEAAVRRTMAAQRAPAEQEAGSLGQEAKPDISNRRCEQDRRVAFRATEYRHRSHAR